MRLWANLGLSLGEVQNVPSGQGTSWPEYFLRQTYVPKAPNSSPICKSSGRDVQLSKTVFLSDTRSSESNSGLSRNNDSNMVCEP